MKRKDHDFGSALKGYLGAMENYWDSVRDAQRAIAAFAKYHEWEDCSVQLDYRDSEGRIILNYRNGDRDIECYVCFAWYTMQSGRKEITAYVC